MADIIVDAPTKTVSAVMTDVEFAVVSLVISQSGTTGLANLFASFIQQHFSVQQEAAKLRIREFIETASAQDLASVLEIATKNR